MRASDGASRDDTVPARRPTLEQVAALAGVGRGTASRVINRSEGVSADARTRVEAAVRQLGYVPHSAARTLAVGRSEAVALAVPEPETRFFGEPYFAGIVRGVSAELAEGDVQLLLTMLRDDRERARFERFVSAHRVAGVLLVSLHTGDPLPEFLASAGVPVVLSGRRSAEERMPYVDADNTCGASLSVRHLAQRGRRRIATITGPPDMYVAQCRLRGYREGLSAVLGPSAEPLVAVGDFTEPGGRRAMHELLTRAPDLDAVCCASDVLAAGALAVLRAAGRTVPDDVALVGFDDSTVAWHLDPPLTTVRQPIEEMGRTMARLLWEVPIGAAGGQGDAASLVLPTELVVRGSS